MKTYTPVYFIKKLLIFLVILIPVSIFIMNLTVVRAEDNKTIINDPPRTPGGFPKILDDDKWPSQILYDTIGGCYQGTIRWVLMSNPQLFGQAPGPMAQRQMVEHCFCVMDKIRKAVEYQEYIKRVMDSGWTGNFFMLKAIECVGEYQTLPSFFKTSPTLDNETITNDNETLVIPEDKPKDSQDEPPGQKPIESENGLPETIFQG